MSSKVICRHCQQDWLAQYEVKSTGEEFFMCPECESIWLGRQDTSEETEDYLSEFLESRGLSWGDLERRES
ncbi:hypothetical protein ACFY04_21360 [Streptomyces sp. NPDC001549]|uniref:hypothetical protein n=1 Tax=Streptomyces sp. NPDC001549 TaxID=3364586 RepID=UPI0036AE7B03